MKVLFGGAFDLLHLGHVLAIQEARKYGDHLTVHVNSDVQVKKKKGPTRPIIPEAERARLLTFITGVDSIIYHPGEEFNLGKLLDEVKPDILIITANEDHPYNPYQECTKRGIKVIEIKRIIVPSAFDTTKIIEHISSIVVAVSQGGRNVPRCKLCSRQLEKQDTPTAA